jgi:hypothetical protein
MHAPFRAPDSVSRRLFLRGAAACVALPALESLAPRVARAAAPSTPPLRMAFVYLPNGVIMDKWTPAAAGPGVALPPTLAPLSAFQTDFQILSGLDHLRAEGNGDGAGDHARANATFLTGCQARKTAGADIRIGVSVDQIAAQAVGGRTRLPSLELSCDHARTSGQCDSGYSCAYQFNLSWRSETTPVAPETDPRLVFERLFGGAGEGVDPAARARRLALRRSILDGMGGEAAALQRRLGVEDRAKLDEYLQAVRETERRVQQSEAARAANPGVAAPEGIPSSYGDHIRLMFDLLALSFETDSTRIASFLMAHDGSNRTFREIGVPNAHHELSHHQGDPGKIALLEKIDHFYVSQFAHFMERLSRADAQGNRLIDHSMIVLGSGISDGNRHSHRNLPVLLAGRGGGLRPGEHRQFEDHVPMTNLYLTMLDRMGVAADHVGDSTGRLEGV